MRFRCLYNWLYSYANWTNVFFRPMPARHVESASQNSIKHLKRSPRDVEQLPLEARLAKRLTTVR
jgi:hypothetical protein